MKYAYQMKAAKVINLKERGIDDIRCRRSIAGSMVLEISVKESADKRASGYKVVYSWKEKK